MSETDAMTSGADFRHPSLIHMSADSALSISIGATLGDRWPADDGEAAREATEDAAAPSFFDAFSCAVLSNFLRRSLAGIPLNGVECVPPADRFPLALREPSP